MYIFYRFNEEKIVKENQLIKVLSFFFGGVITFLETTVEIFLSY
jgi:hypothetical protein